MATRIEGAMDDYPIKVGAMLFTMVDPNPGFEVAYNRWYERDHFYAGCMIGPGMLAGRAAAGQRLPAFLRARRLPGLWRQFQGWGDELGSPDPRRILDGRVTRRVRGRARREVKVVRVLAQSVNT